MSTALIVIAKAPVPGRVKTRLCPPCTPQQAAGLAEAALRDTFAAVAATPARRRICVLDGEPGSWLPRGFEVIPQTGDGLDERLAAAFEAVGEPAFLVGMDTPQLTPRLLEQAAGALNRPRTDAVLGMTHDGGYWGVGLQFSRPEFFTGVPMSCEDTGERQLDRFLQCGLQVHTDLPLLRDVDTIADAEQVAKLAPATQFAATLERFGLPPAAALEHPAFAAATTRQLA